MRVIARSTLRAFVARQAGSKDQGALEKALNAWFHSVRSAQWTSTVDVKRRYATASIISSEQIVFNVKGNDYRLTVAVDFRKGNVWIKWIGTHTDYDRIDAKEIDHDV
jgi:mRNA interferase HigB